MAWPPIERIHINASKYVIFYIFSVYKKSACFFLTVKIKTAKYNSILLTKYYVRENIYQIVLFLFD